MHPKRHQAARGIASVSLPGFGPMVVTAHELQGIEPHLGLMTGTGGLSLLLHVSHPLRLISYREGHPGRIEVPAGSAVLLCPDLAYRLDLRPGRGAACHRWIQFDNILAVPQLLAMIDDATGCVRFSDEDGALGGRLKAVIDAVEKNRADAFWILQAHGHGILRLLLRAKRTPPDGFAIVADDGETGVDPLVDRVTAFLHRHLSARIRLADLAKHLNASPSTISHRYRAATGEAPIQTLHRMRMLQAKRMLVAGAPLRQIATELGFYDEPHFSRAFKKSEGLSPLHFAHRAGSDRPRLGPRPR